MTLEDKVDKIMTNELPHLAERLAKVEGEVAVILGVTVASLLGIATSLFILLFSD